MKKIVGDLLKKRNVDENLKAYYAPFMEMNNKYANIRLAMNYYTYYTMTLDVEELDTENVEGIAVINNVIEELMNDETKKNSSNIAKLEELRQDIINKVQDLTCYVDKFNIYEHALNRVEYRFRKEDYPKGYSDENITRQLMQFILEDEDNIAINRKISQVIGQLPVRLTKVKFFEMLSNGLSIYKGGTKESLKNFLYMLRTTAMLEKTDTMAENYPYLEEFFDEFRQVKFKEMTNAQYNEMKENIAKVSEYMEELMNSNMMIQEILNDLLIVMYTYDNEENDNITKACNEIIKDTNLLFMGKLSPKSVEEIEDMFVMLEGIQEELYPKLSSCDITDQIKESYENNIENLGLTDCYNVVYKLPKLNSDSLFMELENIEDETIADEEYVKQQENALFDEYAELFKDNEKNINRAVMSASIAELPVFFNNISELQDYIYNTLSVCSDKAEKLACIEILNGIMEE